MKYIPGEETIQTFHHYRSLFDAGVMVNSGSDHMVKWYADTSINPNNPFVSIWSVITLTTERGFVIMPSEAVFSKKTLIF